MTISGRNAPCPCGSGKKTKQCCGTRASRYSPSPGTPLHLMDERLVDGMLAFANARFGREWLHEALEAYLLEDMEPEPAQLQLFMPWAMHHWLIQGRPVREWFLAEHGGRLTEAEKKWLGLQASTAVTLWEVREVRRGEGVTVADRLGGGKTCFVHEVKGSQTMKVWDTVLGRVVDDGGIAVFCGVYPRTLPPREAAEVEREARKLLRVRAGQVPREALADDGVPLELIHLWMDTVLLLESTPPLMPQLTNTDGDPLLLTVDHFSFSPEARERVVERLLRMKGAELEAGGVPANIVFLKKGNAMHKSWNNTVVGHARVEKTRLQLETNSLRRADALRARVEEACQGLLTYRTREHSDPEALIPTARGLSKGREASKPEANDPALLAALREFKARHYVDWLDTPLPALKGRTPRAAVRTQAGRREVEMLLKEMEHHESGLPEQERADFASLRGELGLGG